MIQLHFQDSKMTQLTFWTFLHCWMVCAQRRWNCWWHNWWHSCWLGRISEMGELLVWWQSFVWWPWLVIWAGWHLTLTCPCSKCAAGAPKIHAVVLPRSVSPNISWVYLSGIFGPKDTRKTPERYTQDTSKIYSRYFKDILKIYIFNISFFRGYLFWMYLRYILISSDVFFGVSSIFLDVSSIFYDVSLIFLDVSSYFYDISSMYFCLMYLILST